MDMTLSQSQGAGVVGQGFGGGPAAPQIPVENRTALYLAQDDADFVFSAGDNISTWAEHTGLSDLNFEFVSGTQAVKTATHPVNVTGETVDTNNVGGDYQTPAGGTLADFFPDGIGTMYFKFFYDRHVDAFTAPDWIFYAGTDFSVSVVDGTTGKIRVIINTTGELLSLDITDDAWYTVCIRVADGAGGLRIKVNSEAEQSAAGAVISTLTAQPKLFYNTGDAGRIDGAMAGMAFYSVVHSDVVVGSTMQAIDALLET